MLDNLCAKGVVECSKVNKSIDLYSSIPLKTSRSPSRRSSRRLTMLCCQNWKTMHPLGAALRRHRQRQDAGVLKAHRAVSGAGPPCLVLVPEISLTPQMILRLKSRFGRRVAVQHSALNHTERLLQWQMIQDGGADIVVGTRSAVFAPLENIGLVIIDEEQEHTYRSESAPRYAAHEVARQRAAENGSKRKCI